VEPDYLAIMVSRPITSSNKSLNEDRAEKPQLQDNLAPRQIVPSVIVTLLLLLLAVNTTASVTTTLIILTTTNYIYIIYTMC